MRFVPYFGTLNMLIRQMTVISIVISILKTDNNELYYVIPVNVTLGSVIIFRTDSQIEVAMVFDELTKFILSKRGDSSCSPDRIKDYAVIDI